LIRKIVKSLTIKIKQMDQLSIIKKDENVQQAEKLSSTFLQKAEKAIISTDEDVEKATLFLSKVKSSFNQTENMRKVFVQPLNDHVSNINAFFKAITSPLATAERIMKDKVLQFRRIQEQARQKEQARLDEITRKKQETENKKAEKKGVEASIIIAPIVEPVQKSVGNSSFKKVWKFSITKQSLVPREYLIVDESYIRRAVSAGVRDIPGVEIYQEELMASKAN